MSLIKWEPFDDFDRIFRDLSLSPSLKMSNFDLACDVYEDDANLVAEMNLPGLDGENIDVEVEDNHLRISGRREEVQEKKEKSHYAKEIRRGSFERAIPLPNAVKPDQVEAEYANGVLKITMPKKEGIESNKIEVKVK
jgi:HSP20 family protein